MSQTTSDKIRALKLNQSVTMPKAKTETIYVLCSRIGSQLGRKYVTRVENGEHRIWRIA